MTCTHRPSLRERDDIEPRTIGAYGTATAHDCLDCGALVYRIHTRPNLKAVARYNALSAAIPDSSLREFSKTEKRNKTLELLRTLPTGERAARRIRPDEVAA